jgi:ABC-2 type transport system permease protein
MSGLAGLWQVALRELRERSRSKAYLITSAILLLLVVALVVVPQLFEDETDEFQLGVLGNGNAEIVEAAEDLANAADEPGAPPSVSIEVTGFEDRDAAVAAIEADEVEAVLVDGEELILERSSGLFGDSSLSGLLQRAAATVALEEIVAQEGETATDVIQLMTSDSLETTTLTEEDADDESRGVVAYAGLLFLYGAILLYGSWILTGITEEKTNRVVEVLLSTIRPWQLLGGKILGIGALGIAQFAGTVAAALVAVEITGVFDLPTLDLVTAVTLVVWFVIGFLLFAVMFGAAGSLVSRSEDAQTVAFPMSMVAVAGFFLSIISLSDPEGVVAVVGTFVPLTAPFVVPVRSALAAIPAWQYVAAVLLTIGTIVGMVFVGGRIYAGALLRYGGRVGLREAWRGAAE